MADDYKKIPVKPGTFEETRLLKRGGESWDELIQHMKEQYDPEEVDRV